MSVKNKWQNYEQLFRNEQEFRKATRLQKLCELPKFSQGNSVFPVFQQS